MPDVVTDEQWAAARALAEGQPPTHTRIASAMGIHFSNLCHRATQDSRKKLDFRLGPVKKAHKALIEMAARAAAGLPAEEGPKPRDEDIVDIPVFDHLPDAVSPEVQAVIATRAGETPQERLARIGEMILSQTDKLLTRAELSGRTPDRHHVAALMAMTQLAERLADRMDRMPRDKGDIDDAELAKILQRIDDRIHYLANSFAADTLRRARHARDCLAAAARARRGVRRAIARHVRGTGGGSSQGMGRARGAPAAA